MTRPYPPLSRGLRCADLCSRVTAENRRVPSLRAEPLAAMPWNSELS